MFVSGVWNLVKIENFGPKEKFGNHPIVHLGKDGSLQIGVEFVIFVVFHDYLCIFIVVAPAQRLIPRARGRWRPNVRRARRGGG